LKTRKDFSFRKLGTFCSLQSLWFFSWHCYYFNISYCRSLHWTTS